MLRSLVGSEMCIRDRSTGDPTVVDMLLLWVLLVAAANASSVWRYPFASPGLVTTNPRDGLPDFALFDTRDNFTHKTLSCPIELQQPCCDEGGHGDEGNKCCSDPHATRFCRGGLYCDNTVKAIRADNASALIPHFKGAGNTRHSVPRTRRNILQRAVGWLATHAPYLGCHTPKVKYGVIETCAEDDPAECPEYSHTASCEGFVTMAHGAPGYDDLGDRTIIDCKDLKPGDGCFHHDKYPGGGVNHVWMFREWSTPGKIGPMRLYQMGGGGGGVNMVNQTKQTKFCDEAKRGPCIVCFKYSHIVD
eukprot:TRINITY_DN18357_c0_g1_i2.p1 TRINITY_DN18357_c0_g1~~TRINITY_DN18357_c0_g1_i2.p1  ORF type:complete len:305 (+),score=63.09 TRINITY_DN18357_c0_g1_i2:159-1073(+)